MDQERSGSGGFTLLEIIVSVAVFSLAVIGLFSMVMVSTRGSVINKQKIAAMNAAQAKVEEMINVPFPEAFARYNADAGDDPDGVGTARGKNFAVAGLEPAKDDADGFVGEIVMPVVAGDLNETYADASIEMPGDLNNDGDAADTDVSTTYQVLPVIVRVRWRDGTSALSVEYRTRLFPK